MKIYDTEQVLSACIINDRGGKKKAKQFLATGSRHWLYWVGQGGGDGTKLSTIASVADDCSLPVLLLTKQDNLFLP